MAEVPYRLLIGSTLRTVTTALFSVDLNLVELLGRNADERFEVDSANDRVREIGVGEIGAGQQRSREVGAREIGPSEIGAGESAADKRRLFETCPSEICTRHRGNAEINEIELEIGKVKTSQIGKLTLQHFDAHFVGRREGGFCNWRHSRRCHRGDGRHRCCRIGRLNGRCGFDGGGRRKHGTVNRTGTQSDDANANERAES